MWILLFLCFVKQYSIRFVVTILRRVIEIHKKLIEIKECLKQIVRAILIDQIINMGIFIAAYLLQMEVVRIILNEKKNRIVLSFLQPELYQYIGRLCRLLLFEFGDRTNGRLRLLPTPTIVRGIRFEDRAHEKFHRANDPAIAKIILLHRTGADALLIGHNFVDSVFALRRCAQNRNNNNNKHLLSNLRCKPIYSSADLEFDCIAFFAADEAG